MLRKGGEKRRSGQPSPGSEGAWFAGSCGRATCTEAGWLPGAEEQGEVAEGWPPEVRAEAAGPLAPGSSASLDLREAAPWSEKSGQGLALGSRGSILQLMLHS